MTFHQIQYFITLAECLSYTEAAKCLFITQPALSRQIIAMEQEIGTPLFIRSKKNVKLTPGGSALYQRLRTIQDDYNQALDQARTANQGYEGNLRIGFLDVYDVSELFPEVLDEFQRSHSNIEISMERESLGKLPEKLYQDELDLILTYGFSLYDKPNLVTSDIQTFDSYIMMNRKHPLAEKEDLSLADLSEEMFVQLDGSVCEEGDFYILSLLSKSGIHPKMKKVKKMEDILLWILVNQGVSITTNRTTEKQYQDIVMRPIQMEDAKDHTVTMAWKKNNYNPAIAMFMELLETHIQGEIQDQHRSYRKQF